MRAWQIRLLQLLQRRHQRFGHKAAAVWAKTAALVRVAVGGKIEKAGQVMVLQRDSGLAGSNHVFRPEQQEIRIAISTLPHRLGETAAAKENLADPPACFLGLPGSDLALKRKQVLHVHGLVAPTSFTQPCDFLPVAHSHQIDLVFGIPPRAYGFRPETWRTLGCQVIDRRAGQILPKRSLQTDPRWVGLLARPSHCLVLVRSPQCTAERSDPRNERRDRLCARRLVVVGSYDGCRVARDAQRSPRPGGRKIGRSRCARCQPLGISYSVCSPAALARSTAAYCR